MPLPPEDDQRLQNVGYADRVEEEVDLFGILDLLSNYYRKVLVIGGVILFIIVVLFSIYLIKAKNESFVRYKMDVGLLWKEANDKKYPDCKPGNRNLKAGKTKKAYPDCSSFNPEDIVTADVLEKVWKDQGLADMDIHLDGFVKAFSAGYATMKVVEERKEEGSGKVTKEIVEKLNPNVATLRMSLNRQTILPGALTEEQIRRVLESVAHQWSEKFKNRYIARTFPNPLKIVDFGQMKEQEYGEIYRTMMVNLENLIEKVEEAQEDLGSFRSSKSGTSLEEALFQVKEHLTHEIKKWNVLTKSLGVYKNVRFRAAFLISEKARISSRIETLKKINTETKRLISNLRNPNAGGREGSTSREAGQALQSNTGGQMPMVDSAIFEKVFSSGQQAAMSKYIQELAQKYLEGVEEQSNLEYRLDEVQEELKMIESALDSRGKQYKETQVVVQEELEKLIEKYKEMVGTLFDLSQEAIAKEMQRSGGVLAMESSLSSSKENLAAKDALFKKLVIIPGLLLVLGYLAFIAFLVVRAGYTKYRNPASDKS